ncbi:unnamed protein product [Litomosoides sigmodontis]|uniref:Uncharacterized protein n=1 Tax=Litomosoides sigmodontis TaxID=42156 RepID=A0A3P6VAS8_LITSI|nr:unnamed protein product [Litomosoides sigmodontis]
MAKYRAETTGNSGDDGGTNELSVVNSTLATTVQSINRATTLATTTSLSGINDGSGKSVHGVVASLIRAAEKTRFHEPDKATLLNFNNRKIEERQSSIITTNTIVTSEQQQQQQQQQQETGTQTSPYSLSRSSSFDWINESSIDDRYSGELIVASTESPETSQDTKYSSLDQTMMESFTVDRQQAKEMLRQNTEKHDERKMQSSNDIDESIAMLLEYAEDLDSSTNRELHYPIGSEKFSQVTNDSRSSETGLSREVIADSCRSGILPTNNHNG